MPADFTYAAHTDSYTLLLDANGVCRRVTNSRARDALVPSRCVGAQYVASLDPSTEGGLAEMPRAGLSMLFAQVDGDGRITLLRVGPIGHFEALDAPAPRAADSSTRVRPAPLPAQPALPAPRDDAHETPTRRVRQNDVRAELREDVHELLRDGDVLLELDVKEGWDDDTATMRYEPADRTGPMPALSPRMTTPSFSSHRLTPLPPAHSAPPLPSARAMAAARRAR